MRSGCGLLVSGRAMHSLNLVDMHSEKVRLQGVDDPLYLTTLELDTIVAAQPEEGDRKMRAPRITTGLLSDFQMWQYVNTDNKFVCNEAATDGKQMSEEMVAEDTLFRLIPQDVKDIELDAEKY